MKPKYNVGEILRIKYLGNDKIVEITKIDKSVVFKAVVYEFKTLLDRGVVKGGAEFFTEDSYFDRYATILNPKVARALFKNIRD